MKPTPAGANQAALLPKTAQEGDLLDGATGFCDQLARALNAIPLQFLTQRATNIVREPAFQGASGNTDGFGDLLNTQGAVTMIPNETPRTLDHIGPLTANVHPARPARVLRATRDAVIAARETASRAAMALIEVLASRFRETA